MTLSERVRAARAARGISQARAAVLSGLTLRHWSKIENDQVVELGSSTVVAMARTLDVTADYLLGLAEVDLAGSAVGACAAGVSSGG